MQYTRGVTTPDELPPGLPPGLPRELLHQVRNLVRAGITPHVDEIGPRRWRLWARNDRVYADADYRAASRGRIVHLRGALLVDGQRRPLTHTAEELTRLMREPGERPAPPVELEPLLPDADVAAAPGHVQHMHARLARALGGDAVRLGNRGPQWIVAVSTPRAELRMSFLRGKGRHLDMYLRVIIDGEDVSQQVNGDLTRALAMMTVSPTGPAVEAAEGSPAAGTGFGSVGVRRHSVMRN